MPPDRQPKLHPFLVSSLSRLATQPSQTRTFTLTTLRSKPFHTHTLFPHASDPTQAVLRTDFLVLLAERFPRYLDPPSPPPAISVPIFALEASLYTIPSASTAILYISKLDSTGLGPFPPPATLLTEAFISYFFTHSDRPIDSLRVHVFARAAREGQYLFPGSASNVSGGTGDGAPAANPSESDAPSAPRGKRILDDQQLIRWWKNLLFKPTPQTHTLQRFYILPGFDREEAAAIVPEDSAQDWIYGHPYLHLQPPLKVPSGPPFTIGDLIPALSDDPKARFLQCLSRSAANPAGEPGDWDDALQERAPGALEADRVRERRCLNATSVDEFWERMGARQECCDGRVSAFFVIAANLGHKSPGAEETASVASSGGDKVAVESRPIATSSAVPRNVWVTLWSKFHNCDYSRLDKAAAGYHDWIKAVEACVGTALQKIHTELTVENAITETKKRPAGPEPHKPAVTILQARKKVKSKV